MAAETPAQMLASLILDEDVVAFIARRRDNGVSWRVIARELYEATGHKVDVTHETLRAWYTDSLTV